jgi:alkylation response protein AidB-like acyl-CoA dehydrogenase
VDLRYTESDQAFRSELRAFLADAVPAHGAAPFRHDWDARRAYDTGWQRKLFDAGYAGINWPKEYGGRGASLMEELVYYEEMAHANAPYVPINFVGTRHGGPTLIAEGTEAQKEAHLAPILRGDEVWCQGFSEPTAGSDLAALRTSAVRDGDHYVVNGQKIWTSFGHCSEFCELLVRTDPDSKHRGITWIIMPMDLSGIEIRPLPTLLGESDFSEMFLENVRIPIENRVGKENDGWRVTNVTLRFERGTAWASDIILLQQMLGSLCNLAKKITRDDAAAWEDRSLRREIGHLSAEVDAVWAMVKLQVSELAKTGVPGLGGSVIKLAFTELNQRIYELATRLLGRAGLSRDDVAGLPSEQIVDKYLNTLSLTIAAGSSQIQRNIISERMIGMPKEPRHTA